MRKQLLLTSLFLGIAFDILFWGKAPGISFAIFIILCLLAGYLLLRSQNLHPAWRSLLLLVPIIFFSVMTFIRREPFTLFLNYALTLFSTAVFVMTYLSGLWTLYSLSDYVANFFHLVGSMLPYHGPKSQTRIHNKKQVLEEGIKTMCGQSYEVHCWLYLYYWFLQLFFLRQISYLSKG